MLMFSVLDRAKTRIAQLTAPSTRVSVKVMFLTVVAGSARSVAPMSS